jgi:hypothetical protein
MKARPSAAKAALTMAQAVWDSGETRIGFGFEAARRTTCGPYQESGAAHHTATQENPYGKFSLRGMRDAVPPRRGTTV